MPRHKEGIRYEQMYASHLSFFRPEILVVNASERANTTNRIVSSSYLDEYVHPMMPDVTILQLGIVDCFPRLLTNFQRRAVHIASRIRLTKRLADYYIKYLSKRRFEITKKRLISYVSIWDFERNLKLIKSIVMTINSKSKFIVINIPCPGPTLAEKSFDVDGVVQKYNSILNQVFYSDAKFVNLYEETRSNPNLLLADGYHINCLGHEYIFICCRNILQQWRF